ncbi:hypothetical protein ACP70R_007049 [Stipagrostis hirtigluma subsp. patula]
MPRPENPNPSGSPASPRADPRRGPLGPSFCRSASPAAADDAAVSEHPYVELVEWWLARVEGDERKIAVAGFFERNRRDVPFPATPIVKRYDARILKTEDGVLVHIKGCPNISQMLGDGFPTEVCKEFASGFPYSWDMYNELYPRMQCQQNSSKRISASEDKDLFYLQQLHQGEQLESLANDILRSTKSNDANAFQDSSHLPNGTPRFEEHISDGDVPTNGTVVPYKDMSTLVHSEMQTTKKVNFNDKVASDEVVSTSVHSDAQTPKKPVSRSKKQRSAHEKNCATRFATIISPVPSAQQVPIARGRANSVSMCTSESVKLRQTRSGRVIVPKLDEGCQRIAYDFDGSICGVIDISSPSLFEGSKSKTYERKRKKVPLSS